MTAGGAELARPPRGRRTGRRRGVPRHRGRSVADRPARGPAAGRPGHRRGNGPPAGRDRRRALAAWSVASRPRPFDWPGGEADWNVAETIGHVATARSGLVLAASLAAQGRWPVDAPAVVPGVPGSADADVPALIARIEPEPADRRARRPCGGRPRDRRLPARPPARRPAALWRVAPVRRRPRSHAPGPARPDRQRSRRGGLSRHVPPRPRRRLDLPAGGRPGRDPAHAPCARARPARPVAGGVRLDRGRRADRRRGLARARRGDRVRRCRDRGPLRPRPGQPVPLAAGRRGHQRRRLRCPRRRRRPIRSCRPSTTPTAGCPRPRPSTSWSGRPIGPRSRSSPGIWRIRSASPGSGSGRTVAG